MVVKNLATEARGSWFKSSRKFLFSQKNNFVDGLYAQISGSVT